MTDADLCRKREWPPGTRLIGDEGFGPTVIEITAVGETNVLAKKISHGGVADVDDEALWTLKYRDWKKNETGAR